MVCPSWVGDAVMATPSLRAIRAAFPGSFIGGLVRPGIDQVLAGLPVFDEVHAIRRDGVMGPKFTAAKVRPRRYDTALLFTNSFSTALVTRVAGIPRRIGYDRDARGLLLTDRIPAPRRPSGGWAVIPAVDYYWRLARYLIDGPGAIAHDAAPSCLRADPPVFLELSTTPEEERGADDLLARAGLTGRERFAVINPGGNDAAKRWPAERFAEVADHLAARHGLKVLVNGSPGELELADRIAARARSPVVRLPALGITLASLKAIVRRAAVMVTNDTGPRHLAAAFGVPVVTLFGPTDHRWTTIPTRPGAAEAIVLADPTLPETELANDHPERCRIDRITTATVIEAVDRVMVK